MILIYLLIFLQVLNGSLDMFLIRLKWRELKAHEEFVDYLRKDTDDRAK